MIKSIFQNFTLLLVSLLLSFIIGEILIRHIVPQKLIKPCYQNDPDLAIRGVPDCRYHDDWNPEFFEYDVALNNLGIRMPNDVDPDKSLVVSIGDSYTYGLGVDQEKSFWSLLQKDFNSSNGTEQFVNAGFPAYSTGHCTVTLEQLSNKYKVKKAIYFMFFNDVFDNINRSTNYRTHSYEVNKAGLVTLTRVKVYSPIKRLWHALKLPDWLYKNSHLVMLIKYSLQGDKKTISQRESFHRNDLSAEEIELMTKVSLAHLQNLNQLCQSRNIEFQLVWIPCWLELNIKQDYDWINNFPYQAFKTQLKPYNLLDPTAKLNARLDTLSLKTSDLYFREGHFNALGNQLFYESCEGL